jgi:hypothetical protein
VILKDPVKEDGPVTLRPDPPDTVRPPDKVDMLVTARVPLEETLEAVKPLSIDSPAELVDRITSFDDVDVVFRVRPLADPARAPEPAFSEVVPVTVSEDIEDVVDTRDVTVPFETTMSPLLNVMEGDPTPE